MLKLVHMVEREVRSRVENAVAASFINKAVS